MNIVQLTPGAGGMYCGNCFRDSALAAALNAQGHSAVTLPLYLPLTLEETDVQPEGPIFFSGINVYLEQRLPLFRFAPNWLRHGLASPRLLHWIGGLAAKTRAEDVGDITLSMLRGEQGKQARELDELVTWLREHARPDVVCLSNCLLSGVIRRLRQDLGVPVACMLQGEDSFLDALPPGDREEAWRILAERVAEADLLVAPTRYFAARMAERLRLPASRIRVVHNGISLAGYAPPAAGISRNESPPSPGGDRPPVLGYLARMCPEKGLDTLVDAFILLRSSGRTPTLRLRVGGGCSPKDAQFVSNLKARLTARGLLDDVEFHPNLTRERKIALLESLDVFSVPALYGEAFGLYLIEALAAGVPVAQPRHASFPELIAETAGGLLYDPPEPAALADTIESLILNADLRRTLGRAGQTVVRERFSAEAMAQSFGRELTTVVTARRAAPATPAPSALSRA